jgi:hypothetical protein
VVGIGDFILRLLLPTTAASKLPVTLTRKRSLTNNSLRVRLNHNLTLNLNNSNNNHHNHNHNHNHNRPSNSRPSNHPPCRIRSPIPIHPTSRTTRTRTRPTIRCTRPALRGIIRAQARARARRGPRLPSTATTRRTPNNRPHMRGSQALIPILAVPEAGLALCNNRSWAGQPINFSPTTTNTIPTRPSTSHHSTALQPTRAPPSPSPSRRSSQTNNNKQPGRITRTKISRASRAKSRTLTHRPAP